MFSWYAWSNPVSWWWSILTLTSILNIAVWIFTRAYAKRTPTYQNIHNRTVILLSAGYVFVCAFRSILPRADVQRICLFDTWFSSVLLGRSVATIGELCFVAQWAIVLNCLSRAANDKLVRVISLSVFPMIFIAECFSWYAVIHAKYLGNMVEESLWAATYFLIAIACLSLGRSGVGLFKYTANVVAVGCLGYVMFMMSVDVPMYVHRYMADERAGKIYFTVAEGIRDLNTRWRVVYDIDSWRDEIPWMSLYFSFAVWTSLALCYIPLDLPSLKKILKRERV